jgi:hypothetical protein
MMVAVEEGIIAPAAFTRDTFLLTETARLQG